MFLFREDGGQFQTIQHSQIHRCAEKAYGRTFPDEWIQGVAVFLSMHGIQHTTTFIFGLGCFVADTLSELDSISEV